MKSPTLLDLPNEVFFLLFEYLSPLDLVRIGQTCGRLRYLSCDELIWEHRLHKSLGHTWNAVSSRGSAHISEQVRRLDLRELDKRSIYLTIAKFVPRNQLILSNDADIAELNRSQSLDSPEEATSNANSVIETIQGFFASSFSPFETIRKLLGFAPSASSGSVKPEARFALFGSGFDAIATNRLFGRMLDNRTKSFVPINMFTSMHGNLGSGLTVRMTQQAQQAILDEEYHKFLHTDDKDLVRSLKLTKILGPGVPSAEKIGPTDPKDYNFDMVQLFATERYRNVEPRTQLQRIKQSRLFQQPCDVENLQMTGELQNIVKKVNGFVYAIDARDSYDDMKLLRKEIDCLNSEIENKSTWPILLLFVMPKEVIKENLLRENAIARKNLDRINSKSSEIDTFSGAQLTQSWDGSLIEPISAMRLFELENPWRLQKCASNDIKCLVQGVMWLKNQLAGKHVPCTF